MRSRRGILLCIGLGAVTTLTLAAACSLERVRDIWPKSWEQSRWLMVPLQGKPPGYVFLTERFGASSYSIQFLTRRFDVQLESISAADLPGLMRVPPSSDDHTTITITAGLPLRCVRCFVVPGNIEGGWRTPSKYKHGISAIPYFPIWPGLAIDIAIWSTAWWLILVAPGTCRAFVRRRRGRCETCGYDLQGSPGLACPECGTAPRAASIKQGIPAAPSARV